MSNMSNCLFYKITEEEITFIVLFVDDTLIFSKRQIDIDQFVVNMNRHYELTLDTKAGPSKRKARMPTHPYGPFPSHNKEKEQSPPILVTTYLRLLGLLMYLTKSRPDIMAAVSFGATKSTIPTEEDQGSPDIRAHSRQLNTALL
jgi:hypothetical protein